MCEPTQEEIERVRSWQQRKQQESHAEWRRRQEEIERRTLAALSDKLKGRTVVSVHGTLDGADFHSLVLVLSGGVRVEIETNAWSSELELDIEVKET